jgi:hypothetical protein
MAILILFTMQYSTIVQPREMLLVDLSVEIQGLIHKSITVRCATQPIAKGGQGGGGGGGRARGAGILKWRAQCFCWLAEC